MELKDTSISAERTIRDMSIAVLRDNVPIWPMIGGMVLVGTTLLYSILVEGNLAAGMVQWAMIWIGVLGIVLSLVLLYLFYRLVVAVEKIADKL